jgi:hypothetical protein
LNIFLYGVQFLNHHHFIAVTIVMAQNLAEIVHPLVDNGLYTNAEAAVKDLMAGHILHQIGHYRAIGEKFEKNTA